MLAKSGNSGMEAIPPFLNYHVMNGLLINMCILKLGLQSVSVFIC